MALASCGRTALEVAPESLAAMPAEGAVFAPSAGSPSDRLPDQTDAGVRSGPVRFWELQGVPSAEATELLFSALSAEQRLAQLFMLTYVGTRPGAVIETWFEKTGLGGIKVFGWNAENTSTLAQALAAIYGYADAAPCGIPPFIATDQEGGWIRHVKGDTSITPGNMAIGASGSVSDSYTSALLIGRELASLGINMNFGPAVDLATRPDSRIIGTRAFTDDPQDSAVLAAAWSRGMIDAGVIPTAKHFPGHGDTELDSHGVLPVIMIDRATLFGRELVPYRLLIDEGIPAIMSGHLAYPLISGDEVPASLSPVLTGRLLREELRFDGLIITDDLMMNGAASPGGLSETVERALRAGNDILMFSAELSADSPAWRHLVRLYARDEAFARRIDASVRRVLATKLAYFLPRGKAALLPAPEAERALRTDESRLFFSAQALRSISPLNPRLDTRLVGDGTILFAGQYQDFFRAALARYPSAGQFAFSAAASEYAVPSELAAFRNRISAFDQVVVCVANPASTAYVRAALGAGRRVIIVSVMSPYFALEFRDTVPGLLAYQASADSFKAAIAVLAGDFPALGRLPLTVSDTPTDGH